MFEHDGAPNTTVLPDSGTRRELVRRLLLRVGGLAAVGVLSSSEVALAQSSDPRGPTGPTGARGTVGEPGPRGATGFRGPTGLRGETGSTGAPGPMGSAGPAGSPGSRTNTGPTGPNGRTGFAGVQGPAGGTGRPGPRGVQGIAGFQGITGATGPTGPVGFPGSTGPRGPRLGLPRYYTLSARVTIAKGADPQDNYYDTKAIFCNDGDYAVSCGFNVASFVRTRESQPIWIGSAQNDLTGCGFVFENLRDDITSEAIIYLRCCEI